MRSESIKIVEEGINKFEEGNVVKKIACFLSFFRFLSNRCVFDSFCFKRYLVSDFIASNY